MLMYDRLQSEMTIGCLRIANRVVMPAMGVNLAAPSGGVTDEIIAFYEARAAGGAGLIITEVTRVTEGAGISDPCQLSACRISDIPGLQRLTDAIDKYETKIFIQLQHPGREASPLIAGEQPVAPSALQNPLTGGVVPRELSADECRKLTEKFVDAALYAQMAGADGVELHGAHGYLINEFLSPAMNFRNDRYGGSFDNRMSFVREIIAGIRERCGIPGLPQKICERISVSRLDDSAHCFIERGGVRLLDVKLKIGEYNEPSHKMEQEEASRENPVTIRGGCLLHKYSMEGADFSSMEMLYYDSQTRYYSWEPSSAEVKINSSPDDPWGALEIKNVLAAGWMVSDNWATNKHIYTYSDEDALKAMQQLYYGRYDRCMISSAHQKYK